MTTIATDVKQGDTIIARLPLANPVTLTVIDTLFECVCGGEGHGANWGVA